ncbi:MAG: hypothetical protein ACUVQF_09400 [Fervidobacterium sp.]|uniref:hypothetical protein n=1 Tax=Fervidobacterium sp. TaxID=1871331 RepID=UPI00404A2058
MRKKYFHAVVFAFTLAIVVSCTLVTPVVPPPNSQEPQEVVIQISHYGHISNASLVFARDGLNGSWIKLTGTDGIYKFNVNDPSGLYSVAVAQAKTQTNSATKVIFLNFKVSETNFVPVDVADFLSEEHEATLTINLPDEFATDKPVRVFFLNQDLFAPIFQDDGNKTAVVKPLPKGKGDLVITYPPEWYYNETVEKVAIIRDFELYHDRTINLTTSDFKSSEVVAGFSDISLEWLVGGKTVVPGQASLRFDHEIPSSLKNDSDLYLFRFFNRFAYTEYRKTYPSDAPFATSSINPAPLPETLATAEKINGMLKVKINPYSPNLPGMSDILYFFRIFTYYFFPQQTIGMSYDVKLSKGYLQDLANNVYIFPIIDSAEFQPYNIDLTAHIDVSDEEVISSNKTLKDCFIPIDGLKVLVCRQ